MTRDALDAGEPAEQATRDLLLYCHGFCTAPTEHHVGEDRILFPAIMEIHFAYVEPQLLTVLDTLALRADPPDVPGPL